MKKLILLSLLSLFSFGLFSPQTVFAGASIPESTELGIIPGKEENKKELKKQLRKAAKKYKAETKDMTKAEKEDFLKKKITEEQLQVPRKKMLIIGLILLLIGWILSVLFWRSWNFAWLFGFIGTVVIVVWAVLWLLDEI